MPLLAIWLATSLTAQQRSKAGSAFRFWLLGLAFSTLGDVFLMFEGGQYFLMGLGAFLCTHLCYIIALNRWRNGTPGLIQREPEWALPFIGYIIGFLWFLWNGIPAEMKVPVTVYAIVINLMMMSAFQLKSQLRPSSFYNLFGGAILFTLSDSLIALNKFGAPFPYAHFAVMVTYIVGQALLANGVRQSIISDEFHGE